MSIRNAIIAPITQITPSVTKRGLEMLREVSPEGFSIELEGKQTVKLAADERAAGTLEILEELRKIGSPVYIEIHPENRTITKVLIPLIGKIERLSETKENNVTVEISISSALHFLNKSNPDFEEILKNLRTAQDTKALMIITETDRHEIIDVRIFPPEFKIPKLPPLQIPTPPKIKYWWWPFGCANAITEQEAINMFNMVSATSCNPMTVPAPCIPFLYPDDGCWGRAHEMYRLMLNAGVISRKIWIYGSLHVNTKNNPNCQVWWGWHVAPTVCVKGSGWWGWLFRQEKVIDPSLFNSPVSKTMWKSVQGDPNAQLVGTDGSIFYRSYGGTTQTDPTYAQTNQVLATYRLQLKLRSQQFGPPPYANCP